MCAKIALLDDDLINKIAAGEVIENAASVVKELVENSLDAGATVITIALEAGGRALIRITDNGCGMDRDDAFLCLQRHATSKMRSFDDMHAIDTMGFRGEAIPSIASISRFTLLTRPEESAEGTRIRVDEGREPQITSLPCPLGTTIEVQNLFYNVPARKKFQKPLTQDLQEIVKMVTKLALAHPSVQFTLIHNQRTLLTAPLSQKEAFMDQLKERIDHVLGDELFRAALPLVIEKENYAFRGFIGSPEAHRPNRTGQHLFLNGRAVLSLPISYAVRDGYGPILPSQRYPLFILHGTIPGDRIDINVHPQKKEVRLRHEPFVQELIRDGVAQAFRSKSSISLASVAPPVNPSTREAIAALPPLPPLPWDAKKWEPRPIAISSPPPLPLQKKSQVIAVSAPYILVAPESIALPDMPVDTVWVLVHQRYAHERILFEDFLQKERSIERQSLLLPERVPIRKEEEEAFRNVLPRFREIGFTLEEKGGWQITAVPSFWRGGDAVSFITDSLHLWIEEGMGKISPLDQKKRIARLASQKALGGNRSLSSREAEELVNRLLTCETPCFSPSGKATIRYLSKEKLENFTK